MWTCKFCKNSFELMTRGEKCKHTKWCLDNPKLQSNKDGVKRSLKAMSDKKCSNGHTNQFTKAEVEGLPKPNGCLSFMGKKHTDDAKKRMSEARKKWLEDNPEKHPWRLKTKFISAPCETFKNILKENNIDYIEEYQPLLPKYFYSTDICLLEEKIIIEINGNQHYNKDKTLKNYYKNRHNVIENNGWVVYELHYSLVYNNDFIIYFIDCLKNKITVDKTKYGIQ